MLNEAKSRLSSGKTTPIIGLEVHLELKTKSKMFCSCPANHFHVPPNTHTCPVCLGLPGALPVPNQKALNFCLKLGLALNCSVNPNSFFERKNYFYPDLPKGFQISQYQKPLCIKGHLKLGDKTIRINRVHMEEDTGKSVHLTDSTLIDFNRSGVPLVEIVSEPDLTSSIQAKQYLLKIQQLVRYLDISDADIEKGSMRCEPTVNLKIQKNGKTYYTPIVEIKNIASLTGCQKAIDYEIRRQTKLFQKTNQTKSDTGKTTRGWDTDKNQTFLQRQKEGSSDYRYFPEPDIPPINYSQKQIQKIKSTIPELPQQKVEKYKKLKLSDYQANLLAQDQAFAIAFEKAVGDNPSADFATTVANWFLGPLKKQKIVSQKIIPKFFKKIFQYITSKQSSASAAKQIILESYKTGQDPELLYQKNNLFQVSDTNKLGKIVKKVITDNPKAVEDYQKNPNTIGFLIGQVMHATAGSANPQMVDQILKKLLL